MIEKLLGSVKDSVVSSCKEDIAKETDKIMRKMFPEDVCESSGSCLFRAFACICALKDRGITACLQAGTAKWPRKRREDCSPLDFYQYGYEWHLHSEQTKQRLAESMLPEMHCWVGIPGEYPQIVDPTAGCFPAQCRKILDIDWPGQMPPDCFWWNVKDALPEGVEYAADERAIDCGLAFLAMALGAEKYAKNKLRRSR